MLLSTYLRYFNKIPYIFDWGPKMISLNSIRYDLTI